MRLTVGQFLLLINIYTEPNFRLAHHDIQTLCFFGLVKTLEYHSTDKTLRFTTITDKGTRFVNNLINTPIPE